MTNDELRAVTAHTKKPFLVHGAKTKVKRAKEGSYSLHSLWDLGFADKFFGALRSSDFMDILIMDIEEWHKSYLHAVWKRRGVEGLVGPQSLTLTTLHGSKGREKESVFISPDMTQQVMEGFRSNPQPETLLAYVGATRAINNLTVLSPTQLYSYPYPSINHRG